MEAEFEKIKEALQNNDQTMAVKIIMDFLEKQNSIALNIAVTGDSGSGKSTFVNAFRGIGDEDEGAAPTGCVETTKEVKSYPHPNYPNVTLWDLPGIGTTNFPADVYLNRVRLLEFDFFIIISANRFTENDVTLAQEIGKMEKKFYFVRSKIDNDLLNEEKRHRTTFNKDGTLEKIKKNCIQGLQDAGFESPQVFLVSSFELHEYDFCLLQRTLETDLPEHKKRALLFAMPIINLEIITKKKEAFQSQIKYYAVATSVAAGVPVPGLSVTVDASVLFKAVTEYKHGFGLDKQSLERLAATSGVPYDDLKSGIASPLGVEQITQEVILTMLKSRIDMAAREENRFLSELGTPMKMGLSFIIIYTALNHFLNQFAEDAERVFRQALGLGRKKAN